MRSTELLLPVLPAQFGREIPTTAVAETRGIKRPRRTLASEDEAPSLSGRAIILHEEELWCSLSEAEVMLRSLVARDELKEF